jgi:plasmid maintenance system killer protein
MSKTGAKPYMELSPYEKKINKLIPKAEAEAKAMCKKTGKRFEQRQSDPENKWSAKIQHCFETEYFHKAINRLAFKAGLRSYK